MIPQTCWRKTCQARSYAEQLLSCAGESKHVKHPHRHCLVGCYRQLRITEAPDLKKAQPGGGGGGGGGASKDRYMIAFTASIRSFPSTQLQHMHRLRLRSKAIRNA